LYPKTLPTPTYCFEIPIALTLRRTHQAESSAAGASVGHYIRDYERVKLLLAHHTPPADVPTLANLIPTVAREHINLAHQYHPELVPQLTAHE
jgi:hypothetical protein